MATCGKHINFFLIAGLQCFLLPHIVHASSGVVICIEENLDRAIHDLGGTEAVDVLQRTSGKPLRESFPEAEQIEFPRDHKATVVRYTPETLQAFSDDVHAVLAARTRVLGFPMEKFKKWLAQKYDGKIPLPDPYTMQNLFISNGLTVRDFVDDLVHSFLQDTVKDHPGTVSARLWSRFKEAFDFKRDPIHARAWRLAKKAGVGVIGGVSGFLVYTVNYQLQQPISSVINVPSAPVNDYINRVAKRNLTWLSSEINDRLNALDAGEGGDDREKSQQVRDTKKEMVETVDKLGKYNFNGMTHAQAKQVWDSFDTKFYNLTQRMGNLLNGDESGGRDIWMSRHIQNPEGYATGILGMKANLMIINMSMSRLNEEIARNPNHQPTAKQVAQLSEYNADIELNKKTMALILTDWLLNRFFYPEAREPGDAQVSYDNIDVYLGIPGFASDLKEQIGQVLSAEDKHLVPLIGTLPGKPNR